MNLNFKFKGSSLEDQSNELKLARKFDLFINDSLRSWRYHWRERHKPRGEWKGFTAPHPILRGALPLVSYNREFLNSLLESFSNDDGSGNENVM